MEVIMSLARKDFMRTTVAAIAPFALAFGLAANSNDAQALDYGCRTKAEIPALKAQMTAEGQVPVVRFYQDASVDGIDKESKWREALFTMNVDSREGYRLQRSQDGGICVSSKFSDVRLYRNDRLDLSSFMKVPGANAVGSGVNRILHSASVDDGQNPMFRASEYSPYHQSTRMTYVLGNAGTGEGSVVSAELSGSWIKNFTKAIPSPKTANVDHGAVFTPTGEEIVSRAKSTVGPVASIR
jgi:hypothetical protein